MDTLILFLLFLLGKRRRKTTLGPSSSAASRRSGRKTFAEHWAERSVGLMKRARSGARWVNAMTARLGSREAGAAAARWIGIESGGDPRAQSSLNERGLAQVMRKSLSDLGLTEADFDAMTSRATSDETHADLAAKIFVGELIRIAQVGAPLDSSPGWGPGLGSPVRLSDGTFIAIGDRAQQIGLGLGKLRHGLPSLLRELRDQELLRESIPLTLQAAVGTFKPSPRLASFAKGKHSLTGDPARDLLLRFLVPAAVVAFAESAAPMGLTVTEGVLP